MADLRLILAALSVLAAAPAFAEDNQSAYTRIDLAACREEAPDPDDPLESGSWWCDGYGGMPVLVTEGDLRFMVSYGADAGHERAAGQTLPPFNTIGETLEWRLRRGDDGALHPFATILRFFTDAPNPGERKGQFLVITRLGGPGQICQMGWVDALANPDANAVAREVADNGAGDFDCATGEPLAFGLIGGDARE